MELSNTNFFTAVLTFYSNTNLYYSITNFKTGTKSFFHLYNCNFNKKSMFEYFPTIPKGGETMPKFLLKSGPFLLKLEKKDNCRVPRKVEVGNLKWDE